MEHGLVRVLDALTTILLIRALSTQDFGLFSVYQSWVGVALLFLPALEVILYRNYATLKKDGKLARELSIFKVFSIAKVFLALIFCLFLALIPQQLSYGSKIALLLLAFALPLSQAVYGFMREPLKFEMKQELATLLGTLQRIFILLAIFLVSFFYARNSFLLSMACLVVYVLFGFIWYRSASKHLPLKGHVPLKSAFQESLLILNTAVLWIHLNGVLFQFIQTFDTFFLSIYKFPLEEIALYAIAYKTANFFQIIPIALVNSFGVYLGLKSSGFGEKTDFKHLYRLCLFFMVLCLILFVVGYELEVPLLEFVGKGKVNFENLPKVTSYFRWQLVGILALCATHPLSTYLVSKANLKQMSLQIYFPWMIAATILFGFGASLGPAVVVRLNLVTYLLLGTLFWIFFLKIKKGRFENQKTYQK